MCDSPFQFDFKKVPKSETGMCSSPSSDWISLEYSSMEPKTFKLLCQGTSAADKWKRNSDQSKRHCPPIDGAKSLTRATWLVLKKTISSEGTSQNASHIIINSRRKVTLSLSLSLIMSHAGKNSLDNVWNKRLILSRHL